MCWHRPKIRAFNESLTMTYLVVFLTNMQTLSTYECRPEAFDPLERSRDKILTKFVVG